jgi:hypothetical protein
MRHLLRIDRIHCASDPRCEDYLELGARHHHQRPEHAGGYVHQIKRLIFAALVVAATSSPTNAATPEEAFAAGCGGCHPSERGILRKIPPGTEPERRTWILSFMAGHPHEREALTVHLKFSSTSWQKVQFRKDGGNSAKPAAFSASCNVSDTSAADMVVQSFQARM